MLPGDGLSEMLPGDRLSEMLPGLSLSIAADVSFAVQYLHLGSVRHLFIASCASAVVYDDSDEVGQRLVKVVAGAG